MRKCLGVSGSPQATGALITVTLAQFESVVLLV